MASDVARSGQVPSLLVQQSNLAVASSRRTRDGPFAGRWLSAMAAARLLRAARREGSEGTRAVRLLRPYVAWLSQSWTNWIMNAMRVLISGSRGWTDVETIREALTGFYSPGAV